MINSFKNFLVEEDRSTFFTFGRMNPPTIGHEKLLKVLSQKAGKNPYKIYLSQSTDKVKNPLDYQQKIKIARKMFPKYARSIMLDRKIKTVFDVVTKLHSEGSKKITMVVGSDRIREFEVLLAKYNGVKGRHGFYHFEKIDVVSAGDRDPDADDASGMSASKMRAAAKDNNFTQFSQGLPRNVNNNDAKQIYNSVRSGMGLKEQREFKNHIQLKPVSDIRESYVTGKLYEVDDIVLIKETGEFAKIKHLGSNHVVVENNDETTRKWLTDIEKVDNYKLRIASFKESLDEQSMLNKLLQKARLSGKMEKLVRMYLNYRREFPSQGRKGVIQFVRTRLPNKYSLRDADEIINTLNKLVSAGKLPKHLAIQENSVPQDPDIADRKGTQPAKYHAGLSKSTKAARDRQFKKQTKMADNNPAAYKPAPGDKDAKTKPSKYTTAVKRMFGESYTAWTNKEPVEYAKHLEKTFGKPDEMTNSQLCWFAKDGFKRIVIKDEYILHGSPAPHYDFIYCYIDLIVPEKYAKDLAESSGSILIDYLKGEVGARCGSITANATTLNYVLDVVAERVKPSKKEYEKRILGMKKMFDDGKKYTTDWWPDESNDADPKNKYYAEGHSAVCGSMINEYKMSMKPAKPLRFKRMFEKDAQNAAKKRIDMEKERDKIKHDRMMDRARMKDTIAKNRES